MTVNDFFHNKLAHIGGPRMLAVKQVFDVVVDVFAVLSSHHSSA